MTTLGQCAWPVAGSVLVLAASVLFAALMIADRAGPMLSIIAPADAGPFYPWGLGCIRYVHRTWTAAAARGKAEGKPTPLEL